MSISNKSFQENQDYLELPIDKVNLSFITRGQKNPKGLPRVFFASHPDEHNIFLSRIWEMINKYKDVVIFYEKNSLPWDVLKSYLQDMQLIVIPVTTKLLTKENRVISEILPFANEKHIPILPLMFEDGLVEIFSKIFGDLQFLMPNHKDPTSTSFERKLEIFLEEVFVGNELAERVRAAFDAYIFLSYRKKDRAYAQELMRLIHKNERFRDIAIWYDEYLVPGESFNDAIQKALENCNVFSLLVTPSLLECFQGIPNYVMGIEYPKAKEFNKPIVPIEMSSTNRECLEKNYPGIPQCVKREQNEELEVVLGRYLKKEALQESTPEHNFLIGLAYLDGIDVEVDTEKAVTLITSAAKDEVEEAIRKLVSMYQSGKGVQRDYQKSINWQKKLIYLLEKKHEKDKDDEYWESMYDAYGTMGYLYSICMNHKFALSFYLKQIEIRKTLLELKKDNYAILKLCSTINQVGSYIVDNHPKTRFSDEEKFLLESIDYSASLYEKEKHDVVILTYATSILNFAKYYKNLCKYKESIIYYKMSIGLLYKIENMDVIAITSLLADTILSFAETLCRLEKLDESEKYFVSAIEHLDNISKCSGTPDDKSILVLGYLRFGKALMFCFHDKERALKSFNTAISICESIIQEYDTMRSNLLMYDCCLWKRKLVNSHEEVEERFNADERRIEIIKKIKAYGFDGIKLYEMSYSAYEDLGDDYFDMGDRENAKKAYVNAWGNLMYLKGYLFQESSLKRLEEKIGGLL